MKQNNFLVMTLFKCKLINVYNHTHYAQINVFDVIFAVSCLPQCHSFCKSHIPDALYL